MTRRRPEGKFPFKLYAMLEEAATRSELYMGRVFSWSQGGDSFVIYNQGEFMEQFVSRYFKLSKYRSFVSVRFTLSFVRSSTVLILTEYNSILFLRP